MSSTRLVFAAFCLCVGLLGACSSSEDEKGAAGEGPAAADPNKQATASHTLVAYQGASRAASGITRSKAEARERAASVLARAQKGEDFGALAKEFSDGPSGPRGGSLGTFPRGRMVPAFDKAVFGMQAGEVYGELVETPFGFHVIYREK